jgi:predicted ATPase/class 3 adenylate cyclase
MAAEARLHVRTYLFTDIEGSTRMWEETPERMQPALARHDAIARSTVERHRGVVVKKTGDGLHAVFADPLDAVRATLDMQLALADPQATAGVPLLIRCGLHAGADQPREGDFYGTAVNRAARIMSTAHGGQVLLSQAVASLVGDRLPREVDLIDLGAVRLRDLASPERIYQLRHPKLRDKFPGLRSLEATPNNLPQQLTSFVGREADLAEIKKLAGRIRLLTLLGVGGIGKSRLSLQVGAELIEDFPDGVWLVELATLTDPRLVPQAVASVLGVKESAGKPVLEALLRFFKNRRLLLILDNCEHLLQACAELARQLLQAGPHAKVIATSREPLRVTGETTYPVPALPENESERLFLERALAAKPGFRADGGSAKSVASVCRRLDGIPLAIELAAACVRTLSVETIAARIEDRFRLLTRGDQTALPRQQTLRALIDWSHGLLTEEERAVFRRLAVFAGWTLEAAEAVTSFGAIERARVLEHMTQLAEKSLAAVEPGGERYRLLDTVRQYAHEHLEESQEADEARTRHLDFYLALAEKARPELAGPKQGEWLARLDLERENLLAVHAWCERAPNGAELDLKLAYLLRPYWFNRGLLGLGLRITEDALKRRGAEARNVARSRGLFDAGQLSFFMGRYRDAQLYLEESLAIARQIGDRRRVAAALQPLGAALVALGDRAGGRRHSEEAVALAEQSGERRELAGAINSLAQLHRAEGDLDRAEPLYEKVLVLGRDLGDREVIAVSVLNLAMVAIGRVSIERAQLMLLEVLAIAEGIGSKPAGQGLLEVSVGLAALREDWPMAARFYGAAEAHAAASGIHRDATDAAFIDAAVAKARSSLGKAAFAAAEEAGRALSYDEALAQARTWLTSER